MSNESHKIDSERNNSPPFKDFNIFDTLKPEKVETFGTDNVTTGLLIDITDSENHTDPKLLGSLLDIKKTEYNLVDLLENLYVTPQHVRSKKSDLELSFEFDRVDNSSSNIDNVNGKIDTQNTSSKDTSKNKVRSFDEIFDSAVSSRSPKLEFSKTEIQSEYTIDDRIKDTFTIDKTVPIRNPNIYDKAFALTENNLTARPYEINNVFDNIAITKPVTDRTNTECTKSPAKHETPIRNANDDFYQTTKLLKPPKVYSNTEPYNANVNPILKPSNSIEYKFTSFEDSHIFNNISHINLQSLKQNEQTAKKVNPFQSDSVTRYRKNIESSLLDLNKPPLALINNTQPIPVLQTVKKDNKQFIKRRIIKKDSEKIGYTKGPDIYEKSVVLPQIIQRLGERKKALDVQKNLKKKLVLDKGEFSKDIGNFGADSCRMIKNLDVPKLSPQVLMEDCNKERLKAMKLRTAFETFVFSGQI